MTIEEKLLKLLDNGVEYNYDCYWVTVKNIWLFISNEKAGKIIFWQQYSLNCLLVDCYKYYLFGKLKIKTKVYKKLLQKIEESKQEQQKKREEEFMEHIDNLTNNK